MLKSMINKFTHRDLLKARKTAKHRGIIQLDQESNEEFIKRVSVLDEAQSDDQNSVWNDFIRSHRAYTVRHTSQEWETTWVPTPDGDSLPVQKVVSTTEQIILFINTAKKNSDLRVGYEIGKRFITTYPDSKNKDDRFDFNGKAFNEYKGLINTPYECEFKGNPVCTYEQVKNGDSFDWVRMTVEEKAKHEAKLQREADQAQVLEQMSPELMEKLLQSIK